MNSYDIDCAKGIQPSKKLYQPMSTRTTLYNFDSIQFLDRPSNGSASMLMAIDVHATAYNWTQWHPRTFSILLSSKKPPCIYTKAVRPLSRCVIDPQQSRIRPPEAERCLYWCPLKSPCLLTNIAWKLKLNGCMGTEIRNWMSIDLGPCKIRGWGIS